MMRRGKVLLDGSRQGSIDGASVSADKELVHKCHSDPGGGQALGAVPRTLRHRSASGAPRKCVLTLDGYSYVIEQGALTIVRRSSSKGKEAAAPTDEQLDQLDLDPEHLPAVDTPDACDKAALRLRYLLRQLNRGEISAETLQKNLQYAAKVLEAVYIDETKEPRPEGDQRAAPAPLPRRRLRTPCWARCSIDRPEAKLIFHRR